VDPDNREEPGQTPEMKGKVPQRLSLL